MSEKILCVLAGYDDSTEECLSGIQNDLYARGFSGVQTKDVPMHFTMGTYDTTQEDELKERLRRIARTHDAFGAEFNHVGLFRLPANDVLFVAPEVSKEMLLLKDEFRDSKDKFSWSPHTTMLIDTPDVIRDATQIVLGKLPIPKGTVSTLYLYEFWPSRLIMTVHLGQDNQ